MRGYAGIDASLTGCLHFVRNSEIDDSVVEIFDEAQKKNIAIIYIDYLDVVSDGKSVIQEISERLKLEHGPYHSGELVPFLDDLITLAYNTAGLTIVIDHGDIFLAQAKHDFFNLIEAFLVQFHHWLANGKPCHLCFQMERNDLIGKILRAPNAESQEPHPRGGLGE